MPDADLTEHITQLIEPMIKDEGFVLWHVAWVAEQGRKILRVMVDREPGGVNVDDCARISHAIEDLIEVKGLIPSRYDLEVSSPGVNRPLTQKFHFERAIGKQIRLKTKMPLNGRQNYKGLLKEVREDELVMEIDRKDYIVPLSEMAKANIEL